MVFDQPLPRFCKKDVVDIRLPGSQLGDWEQGTVTQVRNYMCGPLYKVTTFSGVKVTVEEDDLRIADR